MEDEDVIDSVLVRISELKCTAAALVGIMVFISIFVDD